MKKIIVLTALAAVLTFTGAAQAASINPTLDDRVNIRLGPFFSSIDSTIKVGSGEEIDLEERLDDSKTTGAIYLAWRVTPRINLEFGYSQINREDSETISSAIPLGGGLALPAGSSVTGELNTSVLRFAAGYSLLRNERSEFGVTVGVNAINIEERLAFSLGGSPGITIFENDSTEPMGSIGVYGTYAFSPQWLVAGRIGYLGLEIGDLEGKMWDAFGGVEFRPWQNVGFGLAYIYSDANVTVKEENVNDIDVNWNYQGPFAYIVLGFGTVAK